MSQTGTIDTLLNENRKFPPRAASELGFPYWHVGSLEEYRSLHKRSVADPEGFWSGEARRLSWFRSWERVLEWKAPDAKWFVGGTLNACFNCVDRHVQAGHGEEPALIWEGEPVGPRTSHLAPGSAYAKEPEVRTLTYRELLAEVSRAANMLKRLGVKRGDVVTVYMPMIPELAVAVLACARIGAAHSVIFGGFAPAAISERVIDAKSRVIVTADGGFRRGEVVPLQKNVEEAVDLAAGQGHAVEHVLVFRRTAHETPSARFASGRAPSGVKAKGVAFHWWHDLVQYVTDACPCEAMESEDMLFLLYTSGSTGKPKGIVHTTGGYLTFVATTARVAPTARASASRS